MNNKRPVSIFRKNIPLIGGVSAVFLCLGCCLFPFNVSAQFSGLSRVERIDVIVPEASNPDNVSPQDVDPGQEKWQSMFGSTHEVATKMALETLNFPEFKVTKRPLISGSNSESGHPNMDADGGDVEGLWYGNTEASEGGVLINYQQLNSTGAYKNIGRICHLTQDQAVPTHAANILHGILHHMDTFEGYSDEDNEVTIRDEADGRLEPYAYYQRLQDETRSHLSEWVDPATGLQYWVMAENAPRAGQDVTFGPRGHYGGVGEKDVYAVETSLMAERHRFGTYKLTARPDIRKRQLGMAAVATANVLKAASRLLPPLVYNLAIEEKEVKVGQTVALRFAVLENTSGSVDCVISIYRDGALLGVMASGRLQTVAPTKSSMPFYSNMITTEWTGMVDFKKLPAGSYVLEVKLTDKDGNVTPDAVNGDFLTQNDTRIPVIVK